MKLFYYFNAAEKRDIEAYHILVRLFESIHHDNQKILRALIYMKDDIQPLWDGSNKTRVHSSSPFLLYIFYSSWVYVNG